MQTTLLGLAIALILALLTALVGPLFVDWTQYRSALEVQASRQLGLPVRVSGPIDVRLLPSPSLLLSRIEIGSDSAQQPLRAKALGIELALGSLIRGQLRATELRLVGPDVVVSLGRDGRLNFPNPSVGFNLNDVSISKLHIEDARLSFVDAASGKRAVLDKLWFGGDVRSLGTGIFRGEGAFVLNGGLHGYRISTSRPDDGDPRIRLNVEPADMPLLVESEGTLSVSEGAPRFEGAVTFMRPVGAAHAGSGQAAMSEPWRFTSRVTATSASALFEQLEFQFGPDERALKATGTAEMTFGEDPRVEAVVSARQIDLDRALASQEQPRRDPVSAVKMLMAALPSLSRTSLPIKIGFGVDGVTLGGASVHSLRGDLAATADGIAFHGVEFRAPGFTQVQMNGHLNVADGGVAFAGPVDVSSVDPRAFVAWLEGKNETPAGTAASLRGRGELTLDDSKLSIDRLVLEVDRKPVNGHLVYYYPANDRKARLDAGLKASDADLDAMMALASAVLKDSKLEKPGEVSLVLDMERARFAGLDAQRAHVKASFDAGGLKIERLNIGDFGGARIDAQGVIDTASVSPRGNMTVNIEARDLSGATALVEKFAPQSLDVVRTVSERAGQASLRAALDVGAAPGGQAGQSQARLDLGGSIGATRIGLKATATGTVAEASKAQVQIDGELAGDDAAMLLRLASLDRFIAAGNTAGRVSLAASGPLNGDVRFEARAAAGNLDARAHGRLRPFSGTGLSGDFDIAVAKADAGALLQPPRSLPVTFSARAALASSSLQLNQISAQIAGTPLRGRLGLKFGPVTETEGDIEIDAVDASAVIAAASGFAAGDKLSSEEPFGRGLYARANGRIGFRAKTASLTDTLVMRGVKGALRLAPADLGVEVEDAEFAKGRLSGELSTRQTPDGTTAKLRVMMKGADADVLMQGVAGPQAAGPHMSGRVNFNAELDAAGRSPKALIGSLNGAGTLTVADARVKGLDPKAFAVAMRAVDQGLPLDGIRVRDVMLPALDNGPLAIGVAEMAFTVSGGQVRFGTLLAQADGADVTMSGLLNLAERTLDSRILLTDKAAATAAGRPEIAMQLKGPVASPDRNVDVAALTGWLALRAVEQQAKKLEAIERGAVPPVTSSVPPPASAVPPPTLPERMSVLPRTRPAAEIRAAPLPPPVDIRPAPGFAPPPPQSEPRPQSRSAPQLLAPLTRESSF